MRTPRTRAVFFLSILATGGCSLMVGAELSDKPADTGGGGAGGDGASSTTAHSSSSSTTTTAQSSSSGELMCAPNTANCDVIAAHGCNVNLMTDPANCGSCHTACKGPMAHCAGGSCK